LLDAVLAEQRRDWLAGKRIAVSERLRQHAEFAADPDWAAELIYHEFTLPEELGESPDWEEHLRRYPQHAATLRLLRQADHLVEQTLGTPAEQPAGSFRDYELLEELGRGGMGVVFKARQKSLYRFVAVKMIRSGEASDMEGRKRFENEAEAVARLQHPNIVQIYEVGQTNGRQFLSLEFVEGQSLARRTTAWSSSASISTQRPIGLENFSKPSRWPGSTRSWVTGRAPTCRVASPSRPSRPTCSSIPTVGFWRTNIPWKKLHRN
jgi:hypothetical protein